LTKKLGEARIGIDKNRNEKRKMSSVAMIVSKAVSGQKPKR